jgi:hypothetical protein
MARRATSSRSSGPSHGGSPAAAFSAVRPGLDVAGIATWVVGDLDGADPPGPHHHGQLTEGPWAVVGGADRQDPAGVAVALEEVEAGPPPHQVVDLEQLDPAAEEPQRPFDLALGLPVVLGPHLRGHHGPVPAPLEGQAQDPFGLAVHRGAVEQVGARLQRLVDPGGGVPHRRRPADVERLPRADPHRRDVEPRPSERPPLHVASLPPAIPEAVPTGQLRPVSSDRSPTVRMPGAAGTARRCASRRPSS